MIRVRSFRRSMSSINRLILNIKRGETPFYRALGRVARGILYFQPPRLPRLLKPPLRLLYEFHYLVVASFKWFVSTFYAQPLFQSRCTSAGRNLQVVGLPYVSGHAEIHIGDNVRLNGRVDILSGRFLDCPRLIIKDRVTIGGNTMITVNREVVIEEDAIISYDCRISDSDGHPRQADLRASNAPLDPRDIRAVRICRSAWIGNGTHIMKGVTIGEGAIIGANSVVISDIPPYSLAMGNPAEVFIRNAGRPKNKDWTGQSSTGAQGM